MELVERTPVAKVEPGVNECFSDPVAAEPNLMSTETSSGDHVESISHSIPPAPISSGEMPKANDEEEDYGSEVVSSSSEENVDAKPASSTNSAQVDLGYLPKVNDENGDISSEFSFSEDNVGPEPIIDERQTKTGATLRRSNSWAVIE